MTMNSEVGILKEDTCPADDADGRRWSNPRVHICVNLRDLGQFRIRLWPAAQTCRAKAGQTPIRCSVGALRRLEPEAHVTTQRLPNRSHRQTDQSYPTDPTDSGTLQLATPTCLAKASACGGSKAAAGRAQSKPVKPGQSVFNLHHQASLPQPSPYVVCPQSQCTTDGGCPCRRHHRGQPIRNYSQTSSNPVKPISPIRPIRPIRPIPAHPNSPRSLACHSLWRRRKPSEGGPQAASRIST